MARQPTKASSITSEHTPWRRIARVGVNRLTVNLPELSFYAQAEHRLVRTHFYLRYLPRVAEPQLPTVVGLRTATTSIAPHLIRKGGSINTRVREWALTPCQNGNAGIYSRPRFRILNHLGQPGDQLLLICFLSHPLGLADRKSSRLGIGRIRNVDFIAPKYPWAAPPQATEHLSDVGRDVLSCGHHGSTLATCRPSVSANCFR